MRRTRLVSSALVFALVFCAVAQEDKVDERRIAEILSYAEARADNESSVMFENGEYPRAIESLRYRYEIRPWDGEIATDLIWMFGNIEQRGDALAYAMRYREENPNNPDRGYAEAELYVRWRMFVRVPEVLERDINRQPPPHRNVFTLLSAAYTRMGFDQDVVRVLDVALKSYPDDPAFLRNRALAAERIGGN